MQFFESNTQHFKRHFSRLSSRRIDVEFSALAGHRLECVVIDSLEKSIQSYHEDGKQIRKSLKREFSAIQTSL